jgi:hypothetical protein
MNTPIHSWTDGFVALRARAEETRGLIELDSGASWPRTTGDDVVAIAATFDPPIREHGAPGIVRRWQKTLADLERAALTTPRETYPENRTFWDSLEMMSVFLDDLDVEVPEERWWSALLDQLGTSLRNAGPRGDGPFGHFDNIKTYDDLYLAEYKHLRELRGADNVPPPKGVTGFAKPIPRTTNADVIELATYWSARLDEANHVMGFDGTVSRWKVALADVERLAKTAKPGAVYANNNEFWRVLADTVVYIAAADEAPTTFDNVVGSIKDSVTHLPENLQHVASKGIDLVAGAAEAVGRVANEAGKGLFAGLGAPVLIGAGLIGLFLITRSHSHEAA